ncbi:MAG: MotA/TolQ/ExbB proton channel family protein [Deltaproteobacteria bacterium]|nr:MotA/TolQ/ExbB proton channel family protein [Deltaproteobacteria bacterium]
MSGGFLSELGRLLALGGFVMPPLVVGACVLWYGIGYRVVRLILAKDQEAKRALEKATSLGDGVHGGTSVLLEAAAIGVRLSARPVRDLRSRLDEAFYPLEKDLGRFRRIISSVVRGAPLAGLLGTVSGMIGTFDALGDPSVLVNTSTGVAGGISEALFSTEMGLIVAVPGLILGRLLDRREETLLEELSKLKDLLVVGRPSSPNGSTVSTGPIGSMNLMNELSEEQGAS